MDNYFLSLLTYGEGYHNYHHTFANDYRNGTKWYHFDPTKWFIWTLSKVGLTTDLKRMNDVVVLKKKIEMDKQLLIERANSPLLVEKIKHLADRLSQNSALLKEKASKEIRKQFRMDWKSWSRLNRYILKMKPAKVQ